MENFLAAHAESDYAFFLIVEPVIDPRIPVWIFESSNASRKRQTVLATVQGILLRIPRIPHDLRYG